MEAILGGVVVVGNSHPGGHRGLVGAVPVGTEETG